MPGLSERLAMVHARIAAAAAACGRDPASVELIAVAKTFPASRVCEAARAGLRLFGESRIQEAERKIPEVTRTVDLPLHWHLVGRLQRNKARRAVELFDVIHSVDRPELVAALSRAAEHLERRPRVLVQVNIDAEPQKGGVAPEQAEALLAAIDACPALEPIGLMAVPRVRDDAGQIRPSFARLRELLETLNAGRTPERRLRELSMGMSADFEAAILEGATWVRIGTAIFGRRGE